MRRLRQEAEYAENILSRTAVYDDHSAYVWQIRSMDRTYLVYVWQMFSCLRVPTVAISTTEDGLLPTRCHT